MVVVACGIGRPPAVWCFGAGGVWKTRLQRVDPDRVTMFHGPSPPMAPVTRKLWLKEEVPRWGISVLWVTHRIFRWDGSHWLLHGYLRDEASIYSGKLPAAMVIRPGSTAPRRSALGDVAASQDARSGPHRGFEPRYLGICHRRRDVRMRRVDARCASRRQHSPDCAPSPSCW